MTQKSSTWSAHLENEENKNRPKMTQKEFNKTLCYSQRQERRADGPLRGSGGVLSKTCVLNIYTKESVAVPFRKQATNV